MGRRTFVASQGVCLLEPIDRRRPGSASALRGCFIGHEGDFLLQLCVCFESSLETGLSKRSRAPARGGVLHAHWIRDGDVEGFVASLGVCFGNMHIPDRDLSGVNLPAWANQGTAVISGMPWIGSARRRLGGRAAH